MTLIYLPVAVFGAAPELAGDVGLKPLQVEGTLLFGLILMGVRFASETLTKPGEPAPQRPNPEPGCTQDGQTSKRSTVQQALNCGRPNDCARKL